MAKPFKLSVKAILEDEQGRCLLLRRSPLCKNCAGQWEWPGGKVDPGEDFAEATTRETLEETGLEIEITGLAGAAQFKVFQVNVVALCMEAQVIGGNFQLSEEHDGSAWVAWADIENWNLAENLNAFMLDYTKKRIHG